MRSTVRRTALAGLLGVLAACSSAPRPNESGTREPARVPTILVVDNRRLTDVTVFVDRSRQRVRLGMVGGPGSARFAIPDDMISTTGLLRIIAQPRAERVTLAEQAIVRPGDTVRFTIDLYEVRVVIDPRP